MRNPFLHQDLEIKNELIEYARKFRQKYYEEDDDMAPYFASALLFANLADYLAAHLLDGLKQITEEATREYMNGRVVIRRKSEIDVPLEKTTRQLKEYDFPSKDKVLELLAIVRKGRNKIAHEIFKTPGEQLEEIGKALAEVCDKTEELVDVINAIYRDMPPTTIIDSMELLPGKEGKSEFKDQQKKKSKK